MQQTLLLILGATIGGWILTMALLSLFSRRPAGLGPDAGRLRPCPGTPNCVCSCDQRPSHAIQPLRFEGNADEAWGRLKTALANLPRTQIVTERDGYLHAESSSLLFRFVDDVECLLDREEKAIHVRSASRAGRSDLGVNRARVEALRRAFAEAGR